MRRRGFGRVTKNETRNELPSYVIEHAKESCTLTKGTVRVAGNAFIIFISRLFFTAKIRPNLSNHDKNYIFFSLFSSNEVNLAIRIVKQHFKAVEEVIADDAGSA